MSAIQQLEELSLPELHIFCDAPIFQKTPEKTYRFPELETTKVFRSNTATTMEVKRGEEL